MSNYYVSGCVADGDEVSTCDDSVAQFWTLYRRNEEGLSEGIIDCMFREDAEAAMRVYKERDALAALTAEPVADVVSWNHPVENRTCAVQLRRFDLLPGELFTAPPAPAADLAELVPDGWKLVPVEPTKEMVAAGQDKFEECIDSGFDSCEDGSTYEYSKISSDAPYLVYIAMLAAAPEVE